jgi:hypothetical protein
LKEGIKKALGHVEILSSPWPKSWLPVKNTLEEMTRNFISQAQYEKLCKRSGITDELPLHEGPVLKFVLKFEDLLPRSIIARFIVRMHEDIHNNLRWRTGAVLSVPIFESLAIVIADVKERKITITVSGKRRREHFAIIRKTFHSIKESFKKLNMTEWIPLSDADDFPVEYQELIGHENAQRDEIFVGRLGRAYKVADLLNGIEPARLRKKEFSWTAFLCHSSKDKPIIKKIVSDLSHKGISYWLDEDEIDPGDTILDKIADGLQNSKMIIPCISKDQLASGWCRIEYQSILSRLITGISKQRIIPLILDDTSLGEMPLFLSGLDFIHYRDAEQYSRLLGYLTKASIVD